MIDSWRLAGPNDKKSHPIIMSVDLSDNLDRRLSKRIKARFGGPGPSGGGPGGPDGGGPGGSDGGGPGGPDGGPGGPDKGGPNKGGPGKGDGRPDNESSDNGGPGERPDDGRPNNGPGGGEHHHEGQGGGNNTPPAGAPPLGTPLAQPGLPPTANNPDPIPSPSTPRYATVLWLPFSSNSRLKLVYKYQLHSSSYIF